MSLCVYIPTCVCVCMHSVYVCMCVVCVHAQCVCVCVCVCVYAQCVCVYVCCMCACTVCVIYVHAYLPLGSHHDELPQDSTLLWGACSCLHVQWGGVADTPGRERRGGGEERR